MRYQTAHIDLATDFDTPVCRGTLRALEDRYQLASSLVGDGSSDPVLTYWVDHDIDRVCSGEKGGCFIPGTRVIAAYHGTLHHEVVHAVLNTRGANYFVEEGLAEFVGGYPIVYDPPGDASPLDQLAISTDSYSRGRLSYPAAASFTHYLAQQGGAPLLEGLVLAVDDDLSPGSIEDMIESQLEMPSDAIEAAYRSTADTMTPGLSRDAIEVKAFDRLEGLHQISVDCDDERSYGPLQTDRDEAYRIYRVQIPRTTSLSWRLHGPDGSRAIFVAAYDSRDEQAIDWLAPDTRALPHVSIAGDAGFEEIRLRRGEHALIVAAPSDGRHNVQLEIEIADEPPRRTPPPSP